MFGKRSVVVFLVIIHYASALPFINSEEDCLVLNSDNVQVFVTISSLYVSTTEQGIVKRQLEINWLGGERAKGDIIGVYNVDPDVDPAIKPIFSIDPSNHTGDYFRSDVELSVKFFDLKTLDHGPCLGYWTAYRNIKNEILSSTCLKVHPFWMKKSEAHLSNLKLNEIMIPGSHDSGSFYFQRETAPLAKYKYAQEENIFNQLVYGLRYFDLRVGYYPKSKDKYYINHNFLRTEHSVKSVLNQVLKFVTATKEIVILDFHNFPIGFKNKLIHLKLLRLITNTFGSLLIPHNEKFKHATFRDFWKQDKRVLVSYDSETRNILYPKLLWPSIPRAWGNKQYPDDLKTYFEDVYEKPVPKGIWASMAELTPNAKTIILHPEAGLRVFADQINRNVTHWFRDLYWPKANIVATDYFLGNDIIDVAIRTNRIKGTCPESSWPYLIP